MDDELVPVVDEVTGLANRRGFLEMLKMEEGNEPIVGLCLHVAGLGVCLLGKTIYIGKTCSDKDMLMMSQLILTFSI